MIMFIEEHPSIVKSIVDGTLSCKQLNDQITQWLLCIGKGAMNNNSRLLHENKMLKDMYVQMQIQQHQIQQQLQQQLQQQKYQHVQPQVLPSCVPGLICT